MEQDGSATQGFAEDIEALLGGLEPIFADGIDEFARDFAERELEAVVGALGKLESLLERPTVTSGERASAAAAKATLEARKARLLDGLRHLWRIQLFLKGQRDQISSPLVAPARGKANSKNSRVRDRVVALLQQRGSTHRADILRILVTEGLVGTERKPMNRLASILSANPSIFSSDGRGEYSLHDTGHTEQPTGSNGPETLCGGSRQHPSALNNPRRRNQAMLLPRVAPIIRENGAH